MSGGSSRRYPPELRERAVRMVATQSGHMSVQIGSTGRRQYQDGSPHGGTDANALQPPQVIWPMQAGTPCPTRA